MERRIIHVDMDAFFASVEQRDRGLRGSPVAVGGVRGRGVVAAASYEARVFGIHSAMSMREALRSCPDLIVVPTRHEHYREESERIRAIMHTFTDVVQPLSIDEAYLDVTGCLDAYGTATEVAINLKRRIREETDLTASAGVGPNKTAAKIASAYRKPDGLTVVHPSRLEEFYAQLDIEKFPGIGAATAKRMHALSIRTGADLRKQSRVLLRQKFGKSGEWFYRMIRGDDDRPVSVNRKRKSVSVERTYFDGLRTREAVEEALASIAGRVIRRLKKAGVTGRTVVLKVRFSDFSQFTRSLTLDHACNGTDELIRVVMHLARQIDNGRPVRLLGVGVSNLVPSDVAQTELSLE